MPKAGEVEALLAKGVNPKEKQPFRGQRR